MTIRNKKVKIVLTVMTILFLFLIISNVSATNETVTLEKDATNDNIDTVSSQSNDKSVKKQLIEERIVKKDNATTESSIQLEDPDIRLSDSEIHPGVEKTFLALVPEDANGSSVFKINSKTISPQLQNDAGVVTYTYIIPKTYKSEEYMLSLVFSGDEKYAGKTVNATLTLTPEGGRVNASMIMNNRSIKYAKPSMLTVKLNKDAFGVIILKANDTNISTIKFSNGVAKYNYTTNLTPGVYTLTAHYNGSYMYTPTTVNATLTIKKLKSTLTLNNITSKAGKLTLFKAIVKNELNKSVSDMNVTFKLKSKVIGSNITDNRGVARLYYTLPSSLYNKTYNISAIGLATNTTSWSKNTSKLKLTQLKTSVKVPNISTKPSKTVVISATVLDQFNNYVTKGTVTFKKSGKTLGRAKVVNGFAKFTYTTNYRTSNKTNVYATYKGDWKYASSTGKGTYQVTKLKTTVSANAIDAKPNSVITFTAIVRDQNQNYATDGSVKFYLNSKLMKTVKVKKGIATARYALKSYSAKNYRIKAVYSGSKIYKPSSNTNTMTVTRYETTITGSEMFAMVGSKSKITLSVVDEERYNVNKGRIKYYINNKYIGSAKVVNGVSTIRYTVPKEYDGKIVKYYANYVKNGIYDSSSYSDSLTVTHQKTVYVSPNGSDTNLGSKAKPYKTIKYALNHISLFGTIKLAPGTYSASGLKLNTSVNIIGSGRYVTFIDGKNSGVPVFNITKKNAVLTMRGITIRNAMSKHQFSAPAIVTSGKLNIINSRFANNTASGAFSGGAIYTNGILNVTNTEFNNNKVTSTNSQGGAIRCYDNTTYITNCKFINNKVTGKNSTGASAIYSDSCDIIINQTTFTQNIAKGKYITGGVIRSIASAIVIENTKFTGNKVTATDYAIGGIIGSLNSGISMIKTTITSNNIQATNTAGGSAVYIETAAMDIKNSRIASNTVSAKNTYGGAIYTYKANININDSQINNNKLTDTDNAYGGALYAYDGQINITKTKFNSNTIKAKKLALAGAIYTYSRIVIKNSEFAKNYVNASNLGGGAIANMGQLTVTHTNFINNTAYHAGDAITATNTSKNSVENNYWGSSKPTWSNLLYSVRKPKAYSKTRIK